MALPELPVVGENPCIANSCSLCCYDIEMILTEEDLARLQKARPNEEFFFEADDGYLQLHTQQTETQHGKPCWFLGNDGKCSVWTDRPAGCRLYPAVWDDGLRAANLDSDYCPHTDEFRLPRSFDDATKRLAAKLETERAERLRSSTS